MPRPAPPRPAPDLEDLLEHRAAARPDAGREPAAAARGALVRALAASKPGGTLLHVGAGSGELTVWLVDGMDLASRLIAVHERDALAPRLDEGLREDLRVTLHCQDVDEFLDDVAEHRFDLVVHCPAPRRAQRVARVVALLAPGGILLGLGGEAAAHPPLEALAPGGWHLARLDSASGGWLLVRVPAPPARHRRGGRGARRTGGGSRRVEG